jgi:hypothetical protein
VAGVVWCTVESSAENISCQVKKQALPADQERIDSR